MIILDTSIWIEFLKHNSDYFDVIKKQIENRNIYVLECVFAELLQGVKNKREKELIISYWENLAKIEIENIGMY